MNYENKLLKWNGEIKMAEDKKQLIKKIKGTSQEFGELLQSNKFEEAFDIANKLNTLLKDDQLNDFTGRELSEAGISDMQDELKKYWWANAKTPRYFA